MTARLYGTPPAASHLALRCEDREGEIPSLTLVLAPAYPEPLKTVLIVEDDVMLALCLQDGLEDAGYRVLELTVAPQAALAAAVAGRPDIALVNIELLGRDDGIALAASLKDIGIPVLFISGQVSRARSAATSAVGSMPKPYTPEAMAAAVTYLLHHLAGDDSFPIPNGLEVFDEGPAALAGETA